MVKNILTAVVFITGLQTAVPLRALAQSDSSSSGHKTNVLEVYKSNRDFSYTSPKGELGGPTKFILTGRLTTQYFLLADPEIPVAFALVPDFTVKVLDQRSAAVRTPSLKLGGIGYVNLPSNPNVYQYLTLKFMHHSNGQDGEALNPDHSINTHDGNFSTNYLVLSYHSGDQIRRGVKSYTLHHDFGLQWHKWFDYEKALEGNYGFTRLIYNISYRKQLPDRENWRLNGSLNYAVNRIAGYQPTALKKRLNTELAFHYSFPFMHKAYLMAAAGYYGEDPYNIYFKDQYSFLRFGVSTNF